jgi:hydrogenase-4 component B
MLTNALPIDFGLFAGCAIALWLLATMIGAIWRRTSSPLLPTLFAGGCVLLLVSAFCQRQEGSFFLELADARFDFVADPLALWFIAIISLIGIPVSLFAPGYLAPHSNKLSVGHIWAGMALLFLSMVGVVLAANAIAFLIAWEVMAFSSFALVASDHQQRSIRRVALVYLGATRVGTAFLMGGFLWVYTITGSWNFTDWYLSGHTALGPALLILVGLATKAGCWPFHIWLPIAHPAAPAPVSAVMSGVMIKTAIYAIVRFFVLGNHIDSPSLGAIILTFGSITAIWGVLFALLQHDLKRLLAYHSVENIGLILMGIGVSVVATQYQMPLIAQLGLAAALFHTLNHAIFKSLLFLGTGSVDVGTGIRNVEKLGGLIHRMPWTAASFVIGSAAICALPPLNGFASEWLLYKGFFGLATTGVDPSIRVVGLLLMSWVGLVGALAIACFVKAVGVVFLGLPRSERAKQATESGSGIVASLVILATICAGLGLGAPLVVGLLNNIVAQPGQTGLLGDTWSLPMIWLSLGLALGIAIVGIWAKKRQAKHPGRRFITWECGFGSLGPRTQYTATSFAQPISRMFGAIYRYAIEVTVRNKQKEHFPGEVEVETVHEAYLETKFYVPILKAFRRGAGRFIMRMQAGSIHQYLLYIAIVLALLLWVGVSK